MRKSIWRASPGTAKLDAQIRSGSCWTRSIDDGGCIRHGDGHRPVMSRWINGQRSSPRLRKARSWRPMAEAVPAIAADFAVTARAGSAGWRCATAVSAAAAGVGKPIVPESPGGVIGQGGGPGAFAPDPHFAFLSASPSVLVDRNGAPSSCPAIFDGERRLRCQVRPFFVRPWIPAD